MSLGDTLVLAEFIGERTLEEGLARQRLYGGDLITNLLELVRLDEQALVPLVADYYELPAAPAGVLPYATAAALERVPREIALRLICYPARFEGGVLSVVVAAPLEAAATLELEELASGRLSVQVALEPRIREALSRDFALPAEHRVVKVLAQLTPGSQRVSSVPPSSFRAPASFEELRRPQSSPPFGFAEPWNESMTPTAGALLAETTRQPMVAARALELSSDRPLDSRSVLISELDRKAESKHSPVSARYPVEQLFADLDNAKDPQRVLDCYFDFVSQFFDCSVLLTVQGNGLELRKTSGSGPALSRLRSERLELNGHPLLSEVVRSGEWRLVSLKAEEPRLGAMLCRQSAEDSAIVPVSVRGRVKLILVVSFDDSAVTPAALGHVFSIEPRVQKAFERAILLRKATSLPPSGGPSIRPYSPRSAPERAQALAQVVFQKATDKSGT